MTPGKGSDEHAAHPLGLTAAVVSMLALASGPLMVREIRASVSVPTIIFWRLWLSMPLMLLTSRLAGGRLTPRVLRAAFLPGVFFAATMMVSFESITRTSIANATLIPSLMPAVVMLFSGRMFGERHDARRLALAAAAFAGTFVVVLTSQSSSSASLDGDLFGIANLACWTAYFVLSKRVRDAGVGAFEFMAAVFLVSVVMVSPWALLVSDDLGGLTARGWTFEVLLVLSTNILGHLLLTWSQRHLTITVTSLLTLSQPVLAGMLAWMILDESLRPVQFLGVALTMAALVGLVLVVRAPAASRTALPVVAE